MRVDVTSAAADELLGDVASEALQKLRYCASELSTYVRAVTFVVSALRSIQVSQP